MDFLEDHLYMLDFEDDVDFARPSPVSVPSSEPTQRQPSQAVPLPPQEDTGTSDSSILRFQQQLLQSKQALAHSNQMLSQALSLHRKDVNIDDSFLPTPVHEDSGSGPTLLENSSDPMQLLRQSIQESLEADSASSSPRFTTHAIPSSIEVQSDKQRNLRHAKLRTELEKNTCPPRPLLEEATRAFLELTDHLGDEEKESDFVSRMESTPLADNTVFTDQLQAVNLRMDALERQFASIAPPSTVARGKSWSESRTDEYDLLEGSDMSHDGHVEKELAEARLRIAELEREKKVMEEKYNNLVKIMSDTVMNAMK